MNKLLVGLLSLTFAVSSFATNYSRKTGDTSWANTNQWYPATTTLPGATDNVALNGGKTLTADIDATVNLLQCLNASSHTATLVVTNDITLTVNEINIGKAAYTNSTGLMSHSAGTVNAGLMYVSGGADSVTTYNLSGSAVLTGTTLDVGQVADSRGTGSVTFNQTGGTVSSTTVQIAGRSKVSYIMSGGHMNVTDLIIGSGITPAFTDFKIGTDALSITVANDLTVGPRGEVTFNLAADGGCTTIEVADLFDVTSGSAKILVDAALYTGGPTNIKLITFGSIGTAFSRQAIMNMPSGLTGSLVYTANSLSLDIAMDISTASISNITQMAGNVVSMDVSASDPEISTIKTTTNLAGGTWQSASYSTNSGGPFAIGALTDPEMTVYVQATNQTSFFKVGDN